GKSPRSRAAARDRFTVRRASSKGSAEAGSSGGSKSSSASAGATSRGAAAARDPPTGRAGEGCASVAWYGGAADSPAGAGVGAADDQELRSYGFASTGRAAPPFPLRAASSPVIAGRRSRAAPPRRRRAPR